MAVLINAHPVCRLLALVASWKVNVSVGFAVDPDDGLMLTGMGKVDGNGGTPWTPMVCQPLFCCPVFRAAMYTTLFPPNAVLKLIFNVSVIVLPLPDADDPTPLIVH